MRRLIGETVLVTAQWVSFAGTGTTVPRSGPVDPTVNGTHELLHMAKRQWMNCQWGPSTRASSVLGLQRLQLCLLLPTQNDLSKYMYLGTTHTVKQ